MAKAKTELNDLYDSLSSEAQQTWDHIGEMGWKPTYTDDGYSATKGDNTAGPCLSIAALYSEVKSQATAELAADPETADLVEELLDEDENGPFLPGAEETVTTVDIPELRQPALEYHACKTEAKDAKDKEKTARDILTKLMDRHHDRLPKDPETGYRFFRVVDKDNPGAKTVQINLIPKGEQIESVIVGEEE